MNKLPSGPEDDDGRHDNPWGYSNDEWDGIVREDTKRARGWAMGCLAAVIGWAAVLWWFGVISLFVLFTLRHDDMKHFRDF